MDIFMGVLAAAVIAVLVLWVMRLQDEAVGLQQKLDTMEATKDHAYAQRNALAIAFAKAAKAAGWHAGYGVDPNGESNWRHVVYVDLPDGRQVSWHVGPQFVLQAIELGEYGKPWDGTFYGRDINWCTFEVGDER